MARDVQNTLIQIVAVHGQMDTSAATEYVKKLQKRGRYIQDVWSWLKLFIIRGTLSFIYIIIVCVRVYSVYSGELFLVLNWTEFV